MKSQFALALLISLVALLRPAASNEVVTCSGPQGKTAQFSVDDCNKAADKLAKGGAYSATCNTCALVVMDPKTRKPYTLPSTGVKSEVLRSTVSHILSSCHSGSGNSGSKKTRRATNGSSSEDSGPVVLLRQGDGKC